MNTLPTELILDFLTYLDKSDINTISKTNKRFNNITEKHKKLLEREIKKRKPLIFWFNTNTSLSIPTMCLPYRTISVKPSQQLLLN